MTNEEAISVIENEIQIDVRLCTGEQVDRFQTALYMAISALRAEPTGDPLTLEQLREMGGQPVWVKVIGKTGISCDGWCEVEIRDKDPFAYVLWPGSEVEDIAKIEDYGKTWSCYAYPPARIDREAWEPCGAYAPKIVTNADRIRAMSDEELAEFLENVHNSPCETCCDNLYWCRRNNAPEPACKNHFADWLRQPVEEG